MRKHSSLNRHQVYFNAAVIAAQANFPDSGFRQKDVRFFIELFSNWMEATLESSMLEIHNTQIARFIQELIRDGYCRRHRSGQGKNKAQQQRFELSRVGIIELLSRMVNRDQFLPLEEYFFVHHVVDSYGTIIAGLAEKEGSQFPPALRIEFEALRDPVLLRDRQLRYVDQEIAKLDQRIKEAKAAAELAKKMFSSGAHLADVVAEVQRRFPYELNNQKPMRELFGEIPGALRRWELEDGALRRGSKLWTPLRDYLVAYRKILSEARAARAPRSPG